MVRGRKKKVVKKRGLSSENSSELLDAEDQLSNLPEISKDSEIDFPNIMAEIGHRFGSKGYK